MRCLASILAALPNPLAPATAWRGGADRVRAGRSPGGLPVVAWWCTGAFGLSWSSCRSASLFGDVNYVFNFRLMHSVQDGP